MNPNVAMDTILAPYGLYSGLIKEWNRYNGLLVAGSAPLAARKSFMNPKPNNVDLWVHGNAELRISVIHQLAQRGLKDYVDVTAEIKNPLLLDKLHNVYRFTRTDNGCVVNVYFTNAPLKDVFATFDISVCTLYFDGEKFGSFQISTEYDIENKVLNFQHKYICPDRMLKYRQRDFTLTQGSVEILCARMKELSTA
jgi:hypothetical protein